MEHNRDAVIRVGEWLVKPDAGEMSCGDAQLRLEARMLRLLLCMVDHAGEVVSIDTLLAEAWQGVVVTPDSVYQAVTALRRLLGDDAKQPTYIATVPRRGYRLIATVERLSPGVSPDAARADFIAASAMPRRDVPLRRLGRVLPAAGAAFAVVALLGIALVGGTVPGHAVAMTAAQGQQPAAIAVMPFLDLTDEMSEEPFADGMVEELVGKLSQSPTLRVAPAASSFYYKERKVSLGDFAHALNVRYVLDGSVRKSGTMLRVAARLTRADDGFVMWSETYDRSWQDKLAIQNDIAGQVAKSLATTLR